MFVVLKLVVAVTVVLPNSASTVGNSDVEG
jgi:hypothetical protein